MTLVKVQAKLLGYHVGLSPEIDSNHVEKLHPASGSG
jgi:hypothetical protein